MVRLLAWFRSRRAQVYFEWFAAVRGGFLFLIAPVHNFVTVIKTSDAGEQGLSIGRTAVLRKDKVRTHADRCSL